MTENTENKIRVLLVDDHRIVREGVKAYLSTLPDIEIVGEVEDGAGSVAFVAGQPVDVVLMDLEMPGELDGIAATNRIRTARPETQVIVVTSHHQDEYIFPAVRAGAISYLLKDVEPGELADAIRKAAEGEAIIDSRVAARIMKELQGLRGTEVNPFTELTEREYEVLRLIAAGKSNAEIAAELVLGESTIKTHTSSILRKLQLDDRTQAAVYAWQKGIVRRSD